MYGDPPPVTLQRVSMPSITFTLGRLHWGSFRFYLKRLQFIGGDVQWIESPGWIEREFTVRGDQSAISQVSRDVRRWVGDMPSQWVQ